MITLTTLYPNGSDISKNRSMDKLINISSVKVTKDHLTFIIDGTEYKLLLSEISGRLCNASELEKNEFTISPSGYGIHWHLIDEDISVNSLLEKMK